MPGISRPSSGFSIIEKPDEFELIRHRKKDQDSEPVEIKKVITKEEVNKVILAINRTRMSENIPTPIIAREWCKLQGLELNSHNRALFEGEEFIWDNLFSDRGLHTTLNDILDLLDFYQIIHYRAGKSTILKKVVDIQLVL